MQGQEKGTKTHNILTEPIPNAKPKVWTYTDEQQAKIVELREVRAHTQSRMFVFRLLVRKYASTLVLPESDPYHPNERKWLTSPGCIERYIRASKWNIEDAKRRINNTLQWASKFFALKNYYIWLLTLPHIGSDASTNPISYLLTRCRLKPKLERSY